MVWLLYGMRHAMHANVDISAHLQYWRWKEQDRWDTGGRHWCIDEVLKVFLS